MATWTHDDCEIISHHYPDDGVLGCLPFLPGRSSASIYRQAAILGVKRRGNYRRGALRPFTTPERCHPLVKKLFKTLRAEGLSLKECAKRAGLKDNTVQQWRRRNPSLINFIAACNVAGLDLKLVETDE